jgi:outer membrane murein-binding lipoprotein Lpp
MPPTIEERVAYLAGKVEEHAHGFGEIRESILHLGEKADRYRAELSARIDGLSGRMDALDLKVDRFREELSSRIDALDQKVDRFREELAARINLVDGRIDALDQKVSRQFIWLVGIQVTVLVSVIGVLLRV